MGTQQQLTASPSGADSRPSIDTPNQPQQLKTTNSTAPTPRIQGNPYEIFSGLSLPEDARGRIAPSRTGFSGQAAETMRRAARSSTGELSLVESEGQFYIRRNGEDWLVQMNPNEPDDTGTLSRRLGLSRIENGQLLHAYIRRDEFFSGNPRREGPLALNEAEISRAIDGARATGRAEREAARELSGFDLTKDRDIGHIALAPRAEDRDPLIAETRPEQYSRSLVDALRAQGHITTPQLRIWSVLYFKAHRCG